MKKLIIAMLALLPMGALAQGGQLNGSGYYRVQNVTTKRYFSIVDNKNTSVGYGGAGVTDLAAFKMLAGSTAADFTDVIASNSATICYVDKVGSQYNIKGQGLDLHQQTGYYLNVSQNANGSYRLYGSSSGVAVYLIDYTLAGWTHPSTGGGDKISWHLLPVDQSATQYFGVKPDVETPATGRHWGTMYAGFAFQPSSTNTKVYVVDRVVGGYAVVREATGVVAENTPVLVSCQSASPADNKLTLQPYQNTAAGSTPLKGNFYCNFPDDGTAEKHTNLTAYNPSTMRMLSVTSDGYPAFVKSSASCVTFSGRSGSYLPANKCYLSVSASAPDVLRIVTEEEFTAGIDDLTTDVAPDADAPCFDLQGRRVAQPAHGVYIRGGRKVFIRE
jgi:hypothetical protein